MRDNARLFARLFCLTTFQALFYMSFKVKVAASGHRFTAAADETVLEAALREGIGLPYGCRNGACGKCAGELLSGEIEYRQELRATALAESRAGKTLFCQACAKTDLEIAVREISRVADLEIKTLPCRVEHMQLLTHDVMQLKLKLPGNERLQFLAGQYIEFLLKDGRRRAFSIANAPHQDRHLELHIRHVQGGRFTGHVFEDMRAKTLLRIEGPLGTFFLREDSDRPIILMGGGTGFAPLKGMLEHAFHVGIERPMHLFWGARAREDLYLHELPLEWARRHPQFRYTPVLSDPAPGDAWEGETGLVSDAVVRHYPSLAEHDIYMSGPPAMIEEATPLFAARGARLDRLYSDAFEFAQDVLDKIKARG